MERTESSLHLFKEDVEDDDYEQLSQPAGCLKRRQPRPPKHVTFDTEQEQLCGMCRLAAGGRGGSVTPTPEPSPTVPNITENEDQTPAAVAPDVSADSPENQTHDRDPEVFRCLSCFSFFIPTGQFMKLLWFFKKKSEAGNVPDEREVPSAAVKGKPLFPFFLWKKTPAIPEGPDAPATDPLEKTQEKYLNSEHNKVREDMADSFTKEESSSSPVKLLITITHQIHTHIKPLPGVVVVNQTIDPFDPKPTKTSEEMYNSSEISWSSNEMIVSDNAVKEPYEPTDDNVIVPIGSVAETPKTPAEDNPTPQAFTEPVLGKTETRPAEVAEERDFNIIKSIVYGGWVASVASLGVVPSGASTLNTLAFALASIISGLFILFHNLREMKNEQPGGSKAETDMKQDRCCQNLGGRGKFTRHATVAVISFLVFGSVAPKTYGLSYLISDNIDQKKIAVVVASLVCILLLALGKARVTFDFYLKTADYYMLTGFVASGISYVAGSLFDKLSGASCNSGSSSTSVAAA